MSDIKNPNILVKALDVLINDPAPKDEIFVLKIIEQINILIEAYKISSSDSRIASIQTTIDKIKKQLDEAEDGTAVAIKGLVLAIERTLAIVSGKLEPRVFRKQKGDNGCPSRQEILDAMLKDQYWTVLNTAVIARCVADDASEPLNFKVNAYKHHLQVHGPHWEQSPDHPDNRGENTLKGNVRVPGIYHGHIYVKGKTYVLEWGIVCPEQRIIALLGLGTHESYNNNFRKKRLSSQEKKNMCNDPANVVILGVVTEEIKYAKRKEAIKDIRDKTRRAKLQAQYVQELVASKAYIRKQALTAQTMGLPEDKTHKPKPSIISVNKYQMY